MKWIKDNVLEVILLLVFVVLALFIFFSYDSSRLSIDGHIQIKSTE